MKVLAIVPVRSGSKRLKNKNILKFGNKPLINHTIDKLNSLKSITKIVVSTDYKNLKKILKKNKKIAIHKRSKNLASDSATVLDVVIDLVKKYPNFDVYSYFLPTCPFISKKDINLGIKKIKNKGVDFCISVIKYEDPIEIALKFKKNKDFVRPVFDNLVSNKTNTKFINPSYRPSGGFYIGKKKSILKYKNFFSGKVKGVIYSEKKFVDIDTIEDFNYGKYLIKNDKNNKN